MRISDWSSDVCSSDLVQAAPARAAMIALRRVRLQRQIGEDFAEEQPGAEIQRHQVAVLALPAEAGGLGEVLFHDRRGVDENLHTCLQVVVQPARQRLQALLDEIVIVRSEEHTSELQSLMRISYAVFC